MATAGTAKRQSQGPSGPAAQVASTAVRAASKLTTAARTVASQTWGRQASRARAKASAAFQAMPVAVALKIFHGASWVHDDLPCFDDAALGRKVAPCTGDDATLGAGQASRTGGEACANSVATGG